MSMRPGCLLLMIAMMAGAEDRHSPVVVELFTSEGCSSCPPADRLLADLVRRQTSAAPVIALSEHVDYWNHLGWRDPYSSSVFSNRQQAYGEVFRTTDVYTPQMVVDGLANFNGSDAEQARKSIQLAARQPKVRVEVTRKDSEGRVSILVDNLGAAQTDKADVFLAVTENNLESSVHAGENAGHTLQHTAVVRSLVRIVQIEAKRGAYTADMKVGLQPGWRVNNSSAVVFVQDRKTRRIIGAAICSL